MTILLTLLTAAAAFLLGAFLWSFAEYLLHRFAMHELKGKGLMSNQHLEHHVRSTWSFSVTHILSWIGMLLVGALVWMPLGWIAVGPVAGIALALGWACGYFFYEYQHAVAHRRAPKNRYQRWVRRNHFQHHFGQPMKNHGVSTLIWDKVFGTYVQTELVRVPRRLALPWMVENGELLPEFTDTYILVGHLDDSERLAAIDRARAFASIAPPD
jgi:sterol desaturase/sphingolipid hydroxylase (fatty acid hydroxylase superfamily)